MSSSTRQPPFLAGRAALILSGAAALILLASWLVIRSLFSGDRMLLTTLFYGAGAVWVAALLGIVPIAILGPRGVMPAVCAYFIGTGLRLVLVMGLAMVAVHSGSLPGRPMAIVLSAFYLPLLAIEVGLVGRYLWQKDFLGRKDGGIADTGGHPREILA
jgi:hypothetical protein